MMKFFVIILLMRGDRMTYSLIAFSKLDNSAHVVCVDKPLRFCHKMSDEWLRGQSCPKNWYMRVCECQSKVKRK